MTEEERAVLVDIHDDINTRHGWYYNYTEETLLEALKDIDDRICGIIHR